MTPEDSKQTLNPTLEQKISGSGAKAPPPIPPEATVPDMRTITAPLPAPRSDLCEIYFIQGEDGRSHLITSAAQVPVIQAGRVRINVVTDNNVPPGAIYHKGDRTHVLSGDSDNFHQVRNGVEVEIGSHNLTQLIIEDTTRFTQLVDIAVAAEKKTMRGTRNRAYGATAMAVLGLAGALMYNQYETGKRGEEVGRISTLIQELTNNKQDVNKTLDQLTTALQSGVDKATAARDSAIKAHSETQQQLNSIEEKYTKVVQQDAELRRRFAATKTDFETFRSGPYTQVEQGVARIYGYLGFAQESLQAALGQITPAEIVAKTKGEPKLALNGDIARYMTERCNAQSLACQQDATGKKTYWVDGANNCDFALGQVFLRAGGDTTKENNFVQTNKGTYCSGNHVDGSPKSVWFNVQ